MGCIRIFMEENCARSHICAPILYLIYTFSQIFYTSFIHVYPCVPLLPTGSHLPHGGSISLYVCTSFSHVYTFSLFFTLFYIFIHFFKLFILVYTCLYIFDIFIIFHYLLNMLIQFHDCFGFPGWLL